MKKLALLSTAFALCAGPALAQEFYIVQDVATKECRIVEERPAASTSITILGDGAVFSTRTEAQRRMKEVCTDTATGTTTIKERK
jgi:hypothetical protein